MAYSNLSTVEVEELLHSYYEVDAPEHVLENVHLELVFRQCQESAKKFRAMIEGMSFNDLHRDEDRLRSQLEADYQEVTTDLREFSVTPEEATIECKSLVEQMDLLRQTVEDKLDEDVENWRLRGAF